MQFRTLSADQSTALNYESATMKDVYNMIAVPFVGVDGGNVPVSALKFTSVVKGDFAADCDFLQIWDGNGGYNDIVPAIPIPDLEEVALLRSLSLDHIRELKRRKRHIFSVNARKRHGNHVIDIRRLC